MESRRAGTKGRWKNAAAKKQQEGADHEQIAVGEVDHGQDAVHHGVAQGDQRIDAADLEGVEELLEDVGHVVFMGWRWQNRRTCRP